MTNYVSLNLFDEPFYEYAVALESNSYILQFTYNERAQLYTLSLLDAERTAIVLGEMLVPSYPMFVDYALENLTGYFYLQKKESLLSEPYKTYPDKLSQYYDFFYIYPAET